MHAYGLYVARRLGLEWAIDICEMFDFWVCEEYRYVPHSTVHPIRYKYKYIPDPRIRHLGPVD